MKALSLCGPLSPGVVQRGAGRASTVVADAALLFAAEVPLC